MEAKKSNDELRIQIQHYRLQEEQSKQDKVFRGKTEIKVKSILANECKIEEQFPQISSDTLEFIKIVVKNPSWLLGKYIEQEWNISPGINKKYNGKVLLIKNSKLIISYWKLEESEDDGEDEFITLVQFVTDVIHKDLVVLVLMCNIHVFSFIHTCTFLQIVCSQNVPMSFRSFICFLKIFLKHSNERQNFSFIHL